VAETAGHCPPLFKFAERRGPLVMIPCTVVKSEFYVRSEPTGSNRDTAQMQQGHCIYFKFLTHLQQTAVKTTSLCPAVCPSVTTGHPCTIFIQSDTVWFWQNLSPRSNLDHSRTTVTDTLNVGGCNQTVTVLNICRSEQLRLTLHFWRVCRL
jgi:hypothetical protein